MFFPYARQDDRNTMHFSVNSIVTDHTYGAFNVNKQGELTGKILIITDPQGAPSLLEQVKSAVKGAVTQLHTKAALDRERN